MTNEEDIKEQDLKDLDDICDECKEEHDMINWQGIHPTHHKSNR